MPRRIVLLDNIRSLFNVGAIFRTCDGAGFSGLYLTGFTPYPPRKEIDKTALGAQNFVPWEYWEDPMPILEKIKADGYKIIVCEQTENSIPLSSLEASNEDICFVFGNEVQGVQKSIVDAADICVELPMLGQKRSLNVSVAAGICLYSVL